MSKKQDERMRALIDKFEAKTFQGPVFPIQVMDLELLRSADGTPLNPDLFKALQAGRLLFCGIRTVLLAGTDQERRELQDDLNVIWKGLDGTAHLEPTKGKTSNVYRYAIYDRMTYFTANERLNRELIRRGLLARGTKTPERAEAWHPADMRPGWKLVGW